MTQADPPPTILVGKRKINLDGRTIPYIVKRSARAKHVRLEVRAETGLMVVIPYSCKLGLIPNLLRAKASWILSNLAALGEFRPPTTDEGLESGDTIPYLGRDLEVVIWRDHGNEDSARLEGNRLVVSLRAENVELNLVLERWYRMQAAELIGGKANKLRDQLGLRYDRLSIREQKTRWGSCSGKGNLSFNWKLIMAPEAVIDYVVIHELAHLEEMNHTKRFWQLVARYCPRWQENKKWLKDHEPELLAKPFA